VHPSEFSPLEISIRLRLASFTGLSMRELEDTWIDCWLAWERHPQFTGVKPKTAVEFWLEPYMVGVYEHVPGRGGITESYIYGAPQTLAGSHDWALKTFAAQFKEIVPIEPWMDIHTGRISFLSNSYNGAGGASECRMRLKSLLPKPIHRLIHRARKANRAPKWSLVRGLVGGDEWVSLNGSEVGLGKGKYDYGRFSTVSKRDMFLHYMLAAEHRAVIRQYMSLEDFWLAATGRVHPDDIYSMVKPPLFRGMDTGLEPIQAKAKRPPKRPSEEPEYVQGGLL
jgi:hypothetical protein